MIGFDGERLARASLTYLAEPMDQRLNALVAACGAEAAVTAVRDNRLPAEYSVRQPETARAADQRAMERWRVRLEELPDAEDLERFCRQGIRLVCPGDAEWPGRLDDLGNDRPYALWVKGNADLRFSCLRSVSVVGSRAATAYGSYVAAELASSVAARGWTVISGAAYGVDAAAHRGALSAGAPTIAVLACGVDQPYPAGHAELLDTIADTGAVVSEWPPGRNATRLRFLLRNRVIAALSPGTAVVEAGERSGALNTARHARDLDRELMAVPGPVTSEQSAGCHTIIREWEGTLVTGAADVLAVMEPLDTVDGSGSGSPSASASADTGNPAGGTDPGSVTPQATLWDAGYPDVGEDEKTTPEKGDHQETGQRKVVSIASRQRDRSGARPRPVMSRDDLDQESVAILDALPVRKGLGTTAVAARAGLPPTVVLRRLGQLASGGFAERCDSGWRIRRI
jgi:DNA processing protein